MAVVPERSTLVAVTAASTVFAGVMDAGVLYTFVASTNCYITRAAAPVASAASGSMFIPAGVQVTIAAYAAANRIAVVRATADGSASLTPLS